jgi:transposase InsO family protein
VNIVAGQVNYIDVQVLRDTGCDIIGCRESLSYGQSDKDTVTCVLFDGRKVTYKVGWIRVDSPFFTGWTKAALLKDPPVDLIIGNIYGATRGDDPQLASVVTRAQAKKPQVTEQTNRFVTELDVTVDNFKQMQADDKSLDDVRRLANQPPDQHSPSHVYINKDGLLVRRYTAPDGLGNEVEQLVIPTQLRQVVLEIAHDNNWSAHMGVAKTMSRILEQFWWPGIRKTVTDYCKTCDVCQKAKKPSAGGTAPLCEMEEITKTWGKIAVDIVGPIYPTSNKGYKYILTVVDTATRWPEAVPLKRITAQAVQEALLDIFSRMGLPDEILSDNGTQFTSDLMNRVMVIMGIKQKFSTPYHPASNGMVERFNGSLKTLLYKLTNRKPKEWDSHIQSVLFAMREANHETTGYSPFRLMFGRTMKGPMAILKSIFTGNQEIRSGDTSGKYQEFIDKLSEKLRTGKEVARENIKDGKRKMKYYHDKKAKDNKTITVNSLVVVMTPAKGGKLERARWHGPYRVIEKISPVNYIIMEKGKRKTYHTNMLVEYYKRSGKQSPTPNTDTDSMHAAYAVVSEETEDNSQCNTVTTLMLDDNESIDNVRVNPELTNSQKKEMYTILDHFADVITGRTGKTDMISHNIQLTTSKPICQKPYPTPFSTKQVILEEVRKMEKAGVIEKSNSPYASPVVLVRKKDGSNRFCIDYRQINRVTVTDAEPIPNQEELFTQLTNAVFFSKIDLVKGYWQIPIDEESKKYTAFQTSRGLYQFCFMPFGLCNAPSTFARCMRKVLGDQENVVSFFDDLLVFGESWEIHNNALIEVLERLRRTGLTAKPSKMVVGFPEVEFLGHVVGNGQLKPQDNTIEKILHVHPPKTKKQVRSIIGLISYYRKFIPNFADITSIFSELVKKGKPDRVVWSEACGEALNEIQGAFSTSPILSLPDLSKPFILRSDASSYAIGACLLQEYDGLLHPVLYASRKLLPRETRYSVIEKEALGLVWSITKFSRYLWGTHFIVQTDHKPLTVLQVSKPVNSRLARWAMTLQEYHFTIQPIAGSENVLADFLSRITAA